MTSQVKAKPAADAAAQISADQPLVSLGSALFKEVSVALDAKLGEATLSVQDLLDLKSGTLVALDSQLNDLVELRLNGQVVARGELVAAGDNFGVRIVEILKS